MVAWKLTEKVPAVVGIPEITPAALKLKPPGSALPDATVQVTTPFPPAEIKAGAVYGEPTCPLGNALVTTTRRDAETGG